MLLLPPRNRPIHESWAAAQTVIRGEELKVMKGRGEGVSEKYVMRERARASRAKASISIGRVITRSRSVKEYIYILPITYLNN